MRKQVKLWWGLMSLFIAMMVVGFSRPVQAAASYQIRPFQMHVTVLKNGDARVTQTMTYHFDADYHGVFNVQDLRGIQGGRLTRVQTQGQDGRWVTARQNTSKQPNTYQLTQTASRLKTKLYHPAHDGSRLHVRYRFYLQGVVTNYQDTAQLNWKLIGSGLETDLSQVKLTIQLPATHIKHLQAWTHGPLTGHTQVDRSAGRVRMTVATVPANTFVESHLLFPTSVTATNPRRVAKKHKVAAQKQEAQLAADANTQRQSRRRLVYGGYVTLLTAIMLVLGGSWWWIRRHPVHTYPHPVPITHFFDVPRVDPALAQSLLAFRWPDARALTGDILMAAGRHQLKIDTIKDGWHQTVRLTKTGTVTNYFLNKCFVRLGVNDSFTLRELQDFAKNDTQGKVSKWFKHWQTTIDQEANQYQDLDNTVRRQHVIWLGGLVTVLVLALVACAWAMGHTWFSATAGLGVVLLLGVWVAISHYWRKIDRNNAEGLVLVNEIRGFRRMLKDIGHFNTAQIGDLILWEEILPYAAAFGLAKQVARQLEIDFGREAVQGALLDYYPLYFPGTSGPALSDSLSTSIGSSIQSSGPSSSTGGSGGFSGGSSGGFGGGSGGGAF